MVCDVVFVSIAVKLLMQWAVKLILTLHTHKSCHAIASNPGLPRSFIRRRGKRPGFEASHAVYKINNSVGSSKI